LSFESWNKEGATDLLVRQKSAAENVDQEVEAETQDHMDHTYVKAMAALALAPFHLTLHPITTNFANSCLSFSSSASL